jgi:cell division protein FtsW
MVLSALALIGLGVVVVHSAMTSVLEAGQWYQRVDVRHTAFAILAVGVMLLAGRVNIRWLVRGRGGMIVAILLLGLAAGLAALVYVPGVGYAMGGKYRWIRLGPAAYSIGLQPSEILKIVLVVFLSALLCHPRVNPRHPLVVLLGGAIVAGCVGLVITQDFGTAVLMAAAAGVVFFLAGVPWYWFALTIPPAVAAFYMIIIRTPFRMQRVMAMLEPWSSDNPATYQCRQSLMAILSGGWTGRGLGEGVRKLGFLPEDTTDFIFASFCEEWGFRGVILLVGLLVLLAWQVRKAASESTDRFGRVLIASLGGLILIQAMLHIAVNMVALPPTGMSLPFISAGGTALVMMATSVGLMVSVTAHPDGTAPAQQ